MYSRRREMVLLAEEIGKDPLHATFEDLERWQDTFESLTRMRLCTALIRPYYEWVHARGYRPDNPAKLLPLPPPPHRLPRPMAEDKVTAMLEGPANNRVRCWLLIAGWMGLRAAEIARMQREDFFVGEEDQVWLHVIGKGDRERNVPVDDWLWAYLEPRMAETGPCWRRERGTGLVTAQHVSQYCNEYLHKIGIPDTLHSLRHRVGTLVLENSGGDLRLVQALLGHADIASTSLYTLVAPRRMAKALHTMAPPQHLDRHLKIVHDRQASVRE